MKKCDFCERRYTRDVLSPVRVRRSQEIVEICPLCWITFDAQVEAMPITFRLRSRSVLKQAARR